VDFGDLTPVILWHCSRRLLLAFLAPLARRASVV
jgi:hypothetical protein